MNRFYATLLLCLTLVALRPNVGFAIILYDTGDPSANTTRPNGPNGFGWDFQGQIGSFLGTAIAPNYFITAQHFGIFANGTNFTYQGSTFQTTASFTDTGSDLVIYQVNGTFNSYASLYTNAGGEVGQGLYVFGRGTQRGAQILVGSGNNQHLAGWGWGASDGVQRWGQNTVSAVENGFVEAAFDQISGVNEAALSAG
ncbi:MAG: hypothetical protein JO117_01130, partial [Verrucomicrobia bacterium]|nr:hypothetical protein [Verrucomicrobiota bacterium]